VTGESDAERDQRGGQKWCEKQDAHPTGR
jgi:hypothetical protein